VGVDRLHILETLPRTGEQAVVDGEVGLGSREHPSFQQEIGIDADRTGDAVLDGDEACAGAAVLDCVEDLLAEGEPHRLDGGTEMAKQCRLAVGAPHALESHPQSPTLRSVGR